MLLLGYSIVLSSPVAAFYFGKVAFVTTLSSALAFLVIAGFTSKNIINLTPINIPGASLSSSHSEKSNYVVSFDLDQITYSKASGVTESVPWNDLEEVFIYAEDAFPIGNIFWVLVGSNKTGCVVPWDAMGGEALLSEMQVRLPNFDSRAVVLASGMLDGFVTVWKRDSVNA